MASKECYNNLPKYQTKVHLEGDNGKDFFSFIHASDIHLGSCQYRNMERSNDFIYAFQQILDLAAFHKVDFILLGGDVFTSLDILPEKLMIIFEMLKTFKIKTNNKIPIISIEGNHDLRKYSRGIRVARGQSWLKFLASQGLLVLLDGDINSASAELFSDFNMEKKKGGKVRIKNAVIYGTRYLGDKTVEFIPKIHRAICKNDGFFHILLQHFGIQGQMDNVPGVDLKYIKPLADRVHYLALGHYHVQFMIDNWIYNPGSSEAACVTDFSYKRGAFLVQVKGNENFEKNVIPLRLKNRKYIWETIFLRKFYNNIQKLTTFILEKLSQKLKKLNSKLDPSDLNMPVLFLSLKGKKPLKSCKINTRNLSERILESFPVIDVRVYQKFEESSRKIDAFF